MSNSFYGGKRGYGFILRSNSQNNGIWTGVGEITDNNSINTLYSGVRRGDLYPGEYAIITDEEGERNLVYRIDESGAPFYITEFKYTKIASGRTAKWFSGTELVECENLNQVIEDSINGDRYLNNENGNVWHLEENIWVYDCNIKGPPGDLESVMIDPNAGGETVTNDFIIYRCNDLSINYSGTIRTNTITVRKAGEASMTASAMVDSKHYGCCNGGLVYDLLDVKDYPQDLHVYTGGMLPPLIIIPPNVPVIYEYKGRDSNGNITEHLRKTMVDGVYIALNNMLILVTTGSFGNIHRIFPSNSTQLEQLFRYIGFEYEFPLNSFIDTVPGVRVGSGFIKIKFGTYGRLNGEDGSDVWDSNYNYYKEGIHSGIAEYSSEIKYSSGNYMPLYSSLDYSSRATNNMNPCVTISGGPYQTSIRAFPSSNTQDAILKTPFSSAWNFLEAFVGQCSSRLMPVIS